MPDRSFFHCERCGATTFLDVATLDAHYCPSCDIYTCDPCWNAAALRCDGCALIRPRRKGIKVAQARLVTLAQVADELTAISSREANWGEPRKDLEIARRLLGVKAASLTAAVAQALRGVGPRQAATAASLKRAAGDQLDDIVRALEPVPTETLGETPRVVRWAERVSRLRHASWLRMTAVGLIVVALASTLGIVFMTQSRSRDEGGLAGTQTRPEGEVAGSLLRRTPAATPLEPPDASGEHLDFSFDTLVTNAPPRGWEAVGGTAAGVPYPNAVDRSVQLVAATGEEASLCTALPGEVKHVSLELSAQSWAGAAIRLEWQGGSFGLEIRPDGIATVQPGGTPLVQQPLEPGWHRVSFNLAPDTDGVGLSIGPRDGQGGSQIVPLPDGWKQPSAGDTRLCLYAPSAAGGELYLDNVTIR